MAGLFITMEGGEGVGKSTQLVRLAARLRALRGDAVLVTREPGGTPGAEAIRQLMLHGGHDFAPLSDTLLVYAARAEHVRVLRAQVQAGGIVLCDRFFDSTLAYQGYGLGVDRGLIAALRREIAMEPDLTLILDAPPAITQARRAARSIDDRYERFDAAFAARVAAGFRAIAAAEPQRCVLIDASGAPEHVAGLIERALADRLGLTC
jgi:dTMP kinase